MSTSVISGPWSRTQNQPIWHFVSSWILLVPLLFFATKGGFLHPNEIAHQGDYSHEISTAAAAQDRLEQVVIWLICLFSMLPLLRRIIHDLVEFKIIAAIPFIAMLSAIWAPEPFETLRRGVYLFLTVIFGMYLSERFGPNQQMRLFLFVGYAAVILSLLAIFFLPRYGLGFTGEWKGIFGHKNDMGVFVIFLLTPAFHLRGESRILRLLYVLAGLLLIYKSQSRTAWVICLGYFGYVLAVRYMGQLRRVDQLFVVLFGCLIVIIIGIGVYQSAGALTGVLGKNATLSGRTRIWSAVITAISKRPLLGYGYGGFWRGLTGESGNVILSVGFNVPHAHSGYLNIWLQLGAVGLSLFIVSLVTALRSAFRAMTSMRPAYIDWYLGLIFLIIISNTDESYILNINEMTTILFVMAYIGLRRFDRLGTVPGASGQVVLA
jgi:exopolysaccharide production protein ExoQ